MFGISRRVLCFAAALAAVLAVSPSAVIAAGNEVVVGYSLSLTGKFSTEAADVHRAYQMWAEEVNARGGLPAGGGKKLPVKLVHYDDASDTNNAIRNYERLIAKDQADLLLSPWGSGHNFAISAVTEKYKYPVILTAAGSDKIFERGFNYVFSTTQLASNMYNGLSEYLATQKGEIKTVAVAYENFLFTQSLHDSLMPKLEQAGIKVVADEQYPMGTQDFTALLTKIKAAKPDAFLLINIMPSSIYATRQMGEVGLKPKLYSVNIGPMFTDEFVGKLGTAAEGVVESGFWHPDLPYSGARTFFDVYKAKYNKNPSTDAAYAYIATQVLEQAIQQAGTLDREKLAQTLHAGKFSTILGPYEYDQRGVNRHQLSFLAQVQKGQRVITWPKEVAKSEISLPAK